MAKTRFFRIAVEGGTTDGRVIERPWIEQMAAGYNPATYTASINCEHIRGYSPDAPFNSYGTVAAVKSEEIELTIDGKKEKRLALLAQLDPNDQLLTVNRAKQKLFTSCEISPNFGGTGKAGLVGLAITDNPASLGTEMLEFAAKAGVANPFSARKLDAANIITAASEAQIELEGDGSDPTGVFASIRGMFDAFTAKIGASEKPAEVPPVVPPASGTGTKDAANDNDLSAFARQIGETVTGAITTYAVANDAAVKKIGEDLAALTARLATNEGPNQPLRQLSTGGGTSIVTDC
ncbi:GPO family capsid scaffolding protein [Sphingomonadaceae bacterium OTU29MARTA1]|nr:GPO family capsid scaffolding protein [Sphingomonadaceae bacterium OTU29MARTA1]